jgi:hypothetical protein
METSALEQQKDPAVYADTNEEVSLIAGCIRISLSTNKKASVSTSKVETGAFLYSGKV